jgi:hypothetical protein
MRTLLAVPTLVLILTVGLASSALAAPSQPIHTTISDTYADTVCGIPVTVTVSGVDNFTPVYDQAGNVISFRDTYEVRVTYTAANGKSVTESFAGQHTGSATTNPDGTVTFVDTYRGVPEKLMSPGGTVPVLGAGLITFVTTVRFNPDGTAAVVSQTILREPGLHPFADNATLFCQVFMAALQ